LGNEENDQGRGNEDVRVREKEQKDKRVNCKKNQNVTE